MARPEIIDELAAEFDPADFSSDGYRWVWYAVEEIRTSLGQGEIRWHAVDRQLQAWRADGRLPILPPTGPQLQELYDHAQPGAAAYYAGKITKAAIAARIVHLGHDARLKGTSPAFDEDRDIADLQAQLDNIVRPHCETKTTLIGDLWAGALTEAITPPTIQDRIPTGLMDLDHLLSGGWTGGQLVVIGARPAIGKTTVAIGLARAAAIHNSICTLVDSLEMSEKELGRLVLSAEARIPLHHIKQGIADDAALARAATLTEKILASPLHIDENPDLTLPRLRAQVRHLTRTANLRLVIVDYLQLMTAPKAENRQGEVAKLSRGLKLLAKEFGITVIILAQLNRGPEHRQDKRPTKSDLRESGAIEQDADIVLLLHREDAYDKESPRAGEIDLIVDKHRGGHPATITAAAQLHYSRVVDLAQT
ncbi:MAG: AAA family ATPase [Catenulispora sp.]|nr:AAA family ATPase [Catenulispora sp.]